MKKIPLLLIVLSIYALVGCDDNDSPLAPVDQPNRNSPFVGTWVMMFDTMPDNHFTTQQKKDTYRLAYLSTSEEEASQLSYTFSNDSMDFARSIVVAHYYWYNADTVWIRTWEEAIGGRIYSNAPWIIDYKIVGDTLYSNYGDTTNFIPPYLRIL